MASTDYLIIAWGVGAVFGLLLAIGVLQFFGWITDRSERRR